MQSGHLELKLECISDQTNGHNPLSYTNDTPGTGLLDAVQLKRLNPTSFICASCSLPLVQSSKLSRYDDLPSEHWAELLEAWMCHSDQRLSDRIALYTTGLWPAPGQALVGGSYILFNDSSLVASNFRCSKPSKVSFCFSLYIASSGLWHFAFSVEDQKKAFTGLFHQWSLFLDVSAVVLLARSPCRFWAGCYFAYSIREISTSSAFG